MIKFQKFVFRLDYGVYCFLCVSLPLIVAQDEKTLPPPPVFQEALPPSSYKFAMKLPPDTDCSVRVKVDGSATDSAEKSKSESAENASGSSQLYSMKLERMVRKGISSATETIPGSPEITFYFVRGWCAYDSPKKGINVRHYLPGHAISNLATYDFPELTWAIPETRQVDPVIKEGAPKVHLYKDGSLSLVVDAVSGYPLRYNDGQLEWTYSYKVSSSPIVIPEQLRKALDHALNARKVKK